MLQLKFHWKDLSKLSSEWNIIKYFKPILNIKFKVSVVFLSKNTKKLCAEVIIKYFQFEIFPSQNLNYWVLTKLQLDIMTQDPMCVSRIWMLQRRRCQSQWGPNYPLEHFNKNIVLHYKYVQNSHNNIYSDKVCRALYWKPCLCN